jgi:hypothetical protein
VSGVYNGIYNVGETLTITGGTITATNYNGVYVTSGTFSASDATIKSSGGTALYSLVDTTLTNVKVETDGDNNAASYAICAISIGAKIDETNYPGGQERDPWYGPVCHRDHPEGPKR